LFPPEARDWIKDCCKPKGISSLIDLISIFIEYWHPDYQTYEDVLQDLTTVLDDEGFTTEIVEELREAHNKEPIGNGEFVNQHPSNPEHALDEGLEDCAFPKEEPKEEIYEEGYQPLREEQELSHDSTEDNKDLIEEREPEEVSHEDEVMVFAPPFDEVIQASIPPAQEEENVVSHFPFQVLMMLYSMIQKVKK
jgi:hypothetical protein